jgi:hypothetical protein
MGLGQTIGQLGGGLAALGVRVERPAAAVPQNAVDPLFHVYHGKILLTSIMGQVTVAITSAGNANTKLVHTPTTGLAAQTDLCAVLDLAAGNNGAVDAVLTIDGTVGNPLLSDEKGGVDDASLPVLLILQPGVIGLSQSAADGAGSIKWVLQYVALDKYAVVTVAA